jgi:hypothetical protein
VRSNATVGSIIGASRRSKCVKELRFLDIVLIIVSVMQSTERHNLPILGNMEVLVWFGDWGCPPVAESSSVTIKEGIYPISREVSFAQAKAQTRAKLSQTNVETSNIRISV